MTEPTLVVMAAGMGRRYGGLKQVDPVGPNGEAIMDYSIYDAWRAGFGRVVFVLREEIMEAFRERFGREAEMRLETVYVSQELNDLPAGFEAPAGRSKPWGTAHAVLSAGHAVEGPFAVINADDFYGPSSFRILHDRLSGSVDKEGVGDYCMVGYELGRTLTENGHVARAICETDAGGNLLSVCERTHVERRGGKVVFTEDGRNWSEIPSDAIVSMNMWGFTPSLFARLAELFSCFLKTCRDDILQVEFFLPDAIMDLLARGEARVAVLRTGESWFGVTYREDKPLVRQSLERLIEGGVYPDRLWE